MKIQLFNSIQTKQKIKRIAYEIYENNFDEKEIVFVGVERMGYVFAELLISEYKVISKQKTQLIKLVLDKYSPLQSEIKLVGDYPLKEKVIILVDDVLNTGRTLVYSLKPFINIEIKKLQTAVIIDRSYKLFPVSADYVGYALSTTLKEHVKVVLDNEKEFGVYLE